MKISNIDVSLDTPPDSVENLYLNTVSFQSFYDLLTPMGEWIQITKEEVNEETGDGNGQSYASDIAEDELVFVWRPAGVEYGWRPYTNGKWVYTERGWVWFGNDQWGSAVYHYGRWWNSRKLGWVWMPGYVWAPAWVQWRVADSQIGWCPLSPRAKWRISTGITESNYRYRPKDEDWVFINKSVFADEISRGSILSSVENGSIVRNSKSVLNIKTENEAVVHAGPDAKDIERASGKSVEQRNLKFVSDRNMAGIFGKEISVFREPLTKYKSLKEKNKNSFRERPAKFKKTKKAKNMIKKRKAERHFRFKGHH
jgi:hypothetical protein